MADNNENFQDPLNNAPQPPAAANANANANVTFALTPARINNDDVIDYSTKEGRSIWIGATKPLTDQKFDCTADGLRVILKLLDSRSAQYGWNDSVLFIPDVPGQPAGDGKDFIKYHGTFTYEFLKQVAETYIDQECRAAQDSMQLYSCLEATLSTVGLSKVTLRESEYTVRGIKSGVLFLKTIIQTSVIDTNATTHSIRNALNSLDTYLATVDYDIEKLNQHVKTQLEALRARGQETHDLLNNLFKAYRSVKDENFAQYIQLKESSYEEGSINLEPETLMHLAETRFKILKEKGTWNAPSASEEKIVALQAKLNKLMNQNKKTGKETKRDNKKQKGKQSDKSGRKRYEPEPWMYKPPKDNDPKEKQYNGKTWHWCKNHEKWVTHRPEDCKGKGTDKPNKNKSAKSESKRENDIKNKKVSFDKNDPKLVRATAAIAQYSEESSDEE